MDWTTIWIIAGVIAAVLVFKRLSLIPPGTARKFLQQGALVVDVRDAGEYRGGHLPQAVNIPLGELLGNCF
ncbi:MAG: rhodanese-like domain-containing protein [Verrucomicrobia bacterium]|nr:rhodanese-like domain-containing protein [Verrucomicrobiota bacterium]